MAMRNFWMTASVDGRANDLTAGPRSRDGHMTISLAQRNSGSSDEFLKVYCRELADDKLLTEVYVKGELVSQYETDR